MAVEQDHVGGPLRYRELRTAGRTRRAPQPASKRLPLPGANDRFHAGKPIGVTRWRPPFAQFTVAPARETHRVECDWTDAELASIPCAFSTAENMLHRANVGAETVLITGASGGVGSAAVQLAKRRGATVIAVCSAAKTDEVRSLGADQIIDRRADLVGALGENAVDVVLDLVGGEQWPALLDVLRRGGRYAISGAIAGPIAQIDLRTLYLKDLTLLGCTFQEDSVFENLLSYIEEGEIRPHVARIFPLEEIARAQEEFLQKGFTGKLVLSIPEVSR